MSLLFSEHKDYLQGSQPINHYTPASARQTFSRKCKEVGCNADGKILDLVLRLQCGE